MQYKDMTDEQKKIVIAKVCKYRKNREMSPEQAERSRKYQREWKQRKRSMVREANPSKRIKMTDEQLKEARLKRSREAWQKMSPEKKKEKIAKQLLRIKSLSEERKAARLEMLREWDKKRPEKRKTEQKEVYREWCRANPDKLRAKEHRRRTNKKGNGGSFTDKEWTECLERHKRKCAHCLKPETEVKLTVDHIIPLSKGGSSWIENIQPLCLSCNSKKGNKLMM